jgi:hypothetical protein
MKSITLGEKLHVIKRYEHKESIVDTGNATGIPELTLRITRKQVEKIKENHIRATRMIASNITQIRVSITEKLGRIMAQWTEHQNQP